MNNILSGGLQAERMARTRMSSTGAVSSAFASSYKAGSVAEAYQATDGASFKDKLEEAMKTKDDEGLRQAAKEFEAYFVSKMLQNMRKTVIDGGLVEKSDARKNFESMLDDEYAKMIAEEEGIGLSKAIYDVMKAYG